MTAGFALFTLGYFGIISLRALFQKYELVKKIRKKFHRLRHAISVRGGSDKSNQILHYEDDIVDDITNYLPAAVVLNSQQLLVRSIFKKCFHQNRFYLITNRTLGEIIQRMMRFTKKDPTRIISYYVLIFGL